MYSDGERGGERHVAEDMNREIPLSQEPEESSPAPAQHELHPPPAEGGSTADAASGASTALSDSPRIPGKGFLVPAEPEMPSPAPAEHELHPPLADDGSTADGGPGYPLGKLDNCPGAPHQLDARDPSRSEPDTEKEITQDTWARGTFNFNCENDKILKYLNTGEERDRVIAIHRQRYTASAAPPAPRNTRLQHGPERAPQHAAQRAAVTRGTPSDR